MSAKSIAESAVHALGAGSLLRFAHRSRARILMYHRFPGSVAEVRTALSFQCDHLSRYYNPIGVNELAFAIREHRPIPPRALAITVDDGYADFDHAFPVFQSFGLKVTLYVVSGFANRELWLWPDQVEYLLENTALQSAAVRLPGGALASVNMQTVHSRRRAFDAICQPLIRAENDERLRVLESLPGIFETKLPIESPARFAPLSWDRLRDMVGEGLDVGCHTHTHPIVSKVRNRDGLYDEITGAKRRMEEMLERPVRSFCYPNGRAQDFDEIAVAAVRAAGFQSAVTTESGLAGTGADLFALPRIGVDPGLPKRYFERVVAGYRA